MQLKKILATLILGVTTLFVGLATTGLFAQTGSSAASADPSAITVYRSPSCGCCKAWIDHLKTNGFRVEDIVTADVGAKKDELGLPTQLASCHTAVVDGYVIEGHVPANDIKQLLKQKPAIAGLAVPGMPAGSPGMEAGGQQDPFDVIAFDRGGKMSTFNHYPAR
jgi:hypothetical protein